MLLGKSLDEIDGLSGPEVAVWQTYLAEHGSVFDRIENLLACLLAVTVNSNRKKGSKPVKPEDFLQRRTRSASKPLSNQELLNKFTSLFPPKTDSVEDGNA